MHVYRQLLSDAKGDLAEMIRSPSSPILNPPITILRRLEIAAETSESYEGDEGIRS